MRGRHASRARLSLVSELGKQNGGLQGVLGNSNESDATTVGGFRRSANRKREREVGWGGVGGYLTLWTLISSRLQAMSSALSKSLERLNNNNNNK